MKRPPARYYITYYQGARLIETIRKSQPMSRTLARHVMKTMRETTHKTGQLIPVRWN